MNLPRMVVMLSMLYGCASSRETIVPVPTPRREVVETLHGVELRDPYRWLEGDENGKITDEVARWTDQQNARTRAVMDNLPGRMQLENRLRGLMELPSVWAPAWRGGRYFFTRREGTQNQPVLYWRESVDGPSKVLVDPNTMDSAGLIAMPWYVPSRDGKRVAVGLYRAGDENTACRFIDVDQRQWLGDELRDKIEDVAWMPDGGGVFYSRLSDPKNPYSRQICAHRLGEQLASDPILFEQYKEGPLATTWGPSGEVDRQCRWMALAYWTSTRANDLWAVDLEQWRRTGEFVRRNIIVGVDATSLGRIVGDTLFLQTNLDAPNGQIFAVDMRNPSRENWKPLVPERKDATLSEFIVSRDYLVLNYDRNAQTQLMLVRHDGSPAGELTLPGIGTANVRGDEQTNEVFISFSSFNSPPTIYRQVLGNNDRGIWHRIDVPVASESMEVKQAWYPSKDGTKVSMFIVHRKGIKLDGSNPTMLTGYGGFNLSQTPYFSATLYPFLEAGGVFAIPNLRGGGEYGQEWHKAGMLERKQNVFDDFIAAAEWLIGNGYTNPNRLAISGGSNGGLLVAAAMTQRPELFAAISCNVPLLDMIRYQRFLMAKFWVPEYGSSEQADQFAYLIKYSPYQKVQPGTKYPAVWLSAGENDTRVHPSHARKMTAALQAATVSDPQAKPVLLWIERDAGHGAGKPLSLRVRNQTDQQIFIMWQLGMLRGG